jgi:2-phospho-L-lactate transferase/gluconeogenesis factor (CofD/UPF0052 family)
VILENLESHIENYFESLESLESLEDTQILESLVQILELQSSVLQFEVHVYPNLRTQYRLFFYFPRREEEIVQQIKIKLFL